MARILDGRVVRDNLRVELREAFEKVESRPTLAIVQVGDRPDSTTYVTSKIKFGESVGVGVLLNKFDQSISEEDLLDEIDKLNKDESVDGIIVQLPLPQHINSEKIINSINSGKDVDGLKTSLPDLITPATGRAVAELLKFYEINVADKKVVVIGRSRLAGGPIAKMLEHKGALVTVCHKGTPNIPVLTQEADILVSAAGVPNLITKDYVKEGQVVIDVGINRILKERGENKIIDPGYKIVGDVAFDEVEPVVAAISPVPGGVGPLTVACLFMNLLDLSKNI